MTKLTVDRETIEQALQQLNLLDGGAGVCESAHHVKEHQHTSREPCPIDKLHQEAIAALRAALAEPEVEQCGYDETTGNCTNNPCCFLPMDMPPAEVPLLTHGEVWAIWNGEIGVDKMNQQEAFKFAGFIETLVRQKAGGLK